ncbi:hypothetical protein, partial [Bacillus cereus]|uniref:hypothetical protein n=1 Tax=Bacillus cereus TaxID=1396 RepID=UPI001E4E4CBE
LYRPSQYVFEEHLQSYTREQYYIDTQLSVFFYIQKIKPSLIDGFNNTHLLFILLPAYKAG